MQYWYNLDNTPMARVKYPTGAVVGDPVAVNAPIDVLEYDTFGRPKGDYSHSSYSNAASGVTPTYGRQYGYDKNGNRTSEYVFGSSAPVDAGAHGYTYNRLNQLASWTAPSGPAVSYTYDKNGNRVTAGASTFVYDNQNRITSGSGVTYVWSDRGTMTSSTAGGVTRTATYNVFGQELTSTASGVTTTLVYDGMSRIASRNGVAFKYSGSGKDAISDGTWTIDRSVAGQPISLRKGTSSRWAITDMTHRDLVAMQSPTGAVDHTIGFDPFGSITGRSGVDSSALTFGFQSDYTDPSTSQVWMGARHYRPDAATFTSRDTLDGLPTEPLSLNRYTYAHGNPLTKFDPDGHAPKQEDYDNFSAILGQIDIEAYVDDPAGYMYAVSDAINQYQLSEYLKIVSVFHDAANAVAPYHAASVVDPVIKWGLKVAALAWAVAYPDTVASGTPGARLASTGMGTDSNLARQRVAIGQESLRSRGYIPHEAFTTGLCRRKVNKKDECSAQVNAIRALQSMEGSPYDFDFDTIDSSIQWEVRLPGGLRIDITYQTGDTLEVYEVKKLSEATIAAIQLREYTDILKGMNTGLNVVRGTSLDGFVTVFDSGNGYELIAFYAGPGLILFSTLDELERRASYGNHWAEEGLANYDLALCSGMSTNPAELAVPYLPLNPFPVPIPFPAFPQLPASPPPLLVPASCGSPGAVA